MNKQLSLKDIPVQLGIASPINKKPVNFFELENRYREMFAVDRDNQELDNDYLLLKKVYDYREDDGKDTHQPLLKKCETMIDSNTQTVLYNKQDEENEEELQVVDYETFINNFQTFSENQLSKMNIDNVLIAGGSINACLKPIPKKYNVNNVMKRKYYHDIEYPEADIDIYIYGLKTEKEFTDKLIELEQSIRDYLPCESVVVRTNGTITIISQYPFRNIQIITRAYMSPAEILMCFDVDASAVGFDGHTIWVTPRCANAICTGYNTFDVTRRSPSYEKREDKYGRRGYKFVIPLVEFDYINPFIFERKLIRLNGLARLLVMEKLNGRQQEYKSYIKKLQGRNTKELNEDGFVRRYNSHTQARINDIEYVSDYNSCFIPWGKEWNAKNITKFLLSKDKIINSNFYDLDKTYHTHPVFVGSIHEVIKDQCGMCPQIPEDKKEEHDDYYVSGELIWKTVKPGEQRIGSFHPITDTEWTDGTYLHINYDKAYEYICNNDSKGLTKYLKQFLSANDENTELIKLLRSKDQYGRTLLINACILGYEKCASILIQAGSFYMDKTREGYNPVHVAIIYNHNKLTETLISLAPKEKSNDICPDFENSEDDAKSEISTAESEKSNDDFSLKKILEEKIKNAKDEYDADVDKFDINDKTWDSDYTALELCIIMGNTDLFKSIYYNKNNLIQLDVDITCSYIETAIKHARWKICEILLKTFDNKDNYHRVASLFNQNIRNIETKNLNKFITLFEFYFDQINLETLLTQKLYEEIEKLNNRYNKPNKIKRQAIIERIHMLNSCGALFFDPIYNIKSRDQHYDIYQPIFKIVKDILEVNFFKDTDLVKILLELFKTSIEQEDMDFQWFDNEMNTVYDIVKNFIESNNRKLVYNNSIISAHDRALEIWDDVDRERHSFLVVFNKTTLNNFRQKIKNVEEENKLLEQQIKVADHILTKIKKNKGCSFSNVNINNWHKTNYITTLEKKIYKQNISTFKSDLLLPNKLQIYNGFIKDENIKYNISEDNRDIYYKFFNYVYECNKKKVIEMLEDTHVIEYESDSDSESESDSENEEESFMIHPTIQINYMNILEIALSSKNKNKGAFIISIINYLGKKLHIKKKDAVDENKKYINNKMIMDSVLENRGLSASKPEYVMNSLFWLLTRSQFLNHCIENNQHDIIKYLFEIFPEDFWQEYYNIDSLLQCAFKHSNIKMLKLLSCLIPKILTETADKSYKGLKTTIFDEVKENNNEHTAIEEEEKKYNSDDNESLNDYDNQAHSDDDDDDEYVYNNIYSMCVRSYIFVESGNESLSDNSVDMIKFVFNEFVDYWSQTHNDENIYVIPKIFTPPNNCIRELVGKLNKNNMNHCTKGSINSDFEGFVPSGSKEFIPPSIIEIIEIIMRTKIVKKELKDFEKLIKYVCDYSMPVAKLLIDYYVKDPQILRKRVHIPNNDDIILTLIRKGVSHNNDIIKFNLDTQTSFEDYGTLRHYGALHGNDYILEDANIYADSTVYGMNIIHYLILSKKYELLENYLLKFKNQCGNLLFMENIFGQTPLDLMINYGISNNHKYIKLHGALMNKYNGNKRIQMSIIDVNKGFAAMIEHIKSIKIN
jgi:hypothetical protein